MTTIRKAQAYFAAAPRQAIEDAAGLAALAGLVFLGFNLPAFF